MRTWLAAVAALCVLAGPGQIVFAEEQDERIYLDEDYDDARTWSVGLGIGLVDIGDSVIDATTILNDDDDEQFLMLNLRIPFGDRHAHRGPDRTGFRGYLEPELGYWEGDFATDLVVGLNVIGGMPFKAVELFIGGGVGMHFLDTDFALPSGKTSDDSLGVNVQFGLDVSASESISFFGLSRFDLIDDGRDELESKLAIGLRFHF